MLEGAEQGDLLGLGQEQEPRQNRGGHAAAALGIVGQGRAMDRGGRRPCKGEHAGLDRATCLGLSRRHAVRTIQSAAIVGIVDHRAAARGGDLFDDCNLRLERAERAIVIVARIEQPALGGVPRRRCRGATGSGLRQ